MEMGVIKGPRCRAKASLFVEGLIKLEDGLEVINREKSM
jgi:hypothetical protein